MPTTSSRTSRSSRTRSVAKSPQSNQLLQRIWHGVLIACDVVPVLVPTMLAVFGSVAVLFLVFNHFQTMPILLIGGLLSLASGAAVVRYYPRTPLSNREWHIGNLLLIIGVLLWGSFNVFFTSEHVLTNRDPATYAVAGQWLINHDSLQIPVPTEFGNVWGVVQGSAGFGLDLNSGHPFIYAQGLHLLPAMLGLIGRAVGEVYMLHANVLFGMTALLAVYGFGRYLARARWVLLATAAFAVSMPLLYFSRDTYTEPLAATFTFGSLALLWLAVKHQRLIWWFLAGFVAGAGALARIDAHLAFIGIILFLGIWVAFAVRAKRRLAVQQVAATFIGLVIPAVIGWFDAIKLSWPYYHALQSQFYHELAAIALALIVGAVLVYVVWKTTLLKEIDRRTRNWRQPAIAFAIIGFVLVLSCRPFAVWYFEHLQSAGVHLAPKHNFAELTTYSISWYLGPILAIAGLCGIALAAAWASVRRDLLLVAAVLVVTTTALVYLIQPSISPDQIWASRRFLPVIFPGVAMFGALALDWLAQRYVDKERFGQYFAGLAAAFIFIGALYVSSPLILVRDTTRLSSVLAVCDSLPKNSAVLMVGLARLQLVQPVHAYCNFPTMAYHRRDGDMPHPDTLALVAKNLRAAGKVPVIGVYGDQLSFLDPSDQTHLTDIDNYSYRALEQAFVSPPLKLVTQTGSFYFGIIQPDGHIRPLQ